MNRNIYRYYVSTCIPYGGTEKDGIRCKVVNSDGESSEHTVNCLEFDVIASAYQDIIEESRMRCLIEEYWNEHGFTNFPSMDRIIEHLTGIGLMEYGEGHTKREAIDSLAKKAFFVLSISPPFAVSLPEEN